MKLLSFLFFLVLGSASALTWTDLGDLFSRLWRSDLEDLQVDDAATGTPNLLQLAQDLKLNKCVEKLTEVGINRVINHEGWFTLFCPTDEAFAHEKFFPGQDSLTDKMRIHVARGLYNSSAFENEVVFRSLLSKRMIRMNVYSTEKTSLVTANGQPVVSTNHRARNGYIHIISGVMSSIYDRGGSVISEIEDCCPQHSEVIEMMKHAGLYKKLDSTNPITFLAPTNGAFTSLHPDFLIHLKNNMRLLKEVLNAHVIPGTWYTAGLFNGDKLRTWAGNYLVVSRQQDGTIKFSDAVTGWANINANNGVTHVVESVVIPTNVQVEIKQILHRLHYQN